MSIKNFTVKAKALKNKGAGLISYSTYLFSNKPESHEHTDILNIFPNLPNFKEFCNSTILNILDVEGNNKKGGRAFNSYGTSFVCSLPPTVKKPTEKEWQEIAKSIVISIHKELFKQTEPGFHKKTGKPKKDIRYSGEIPSINDFAKSLMMNVHNQSNPHLNIIIPAVYGGERLKRADQPATLLAIKNTFSKQALLVAGIDYEKYEPKETNVGKQSKWQIEQKKAIQAKREALDEQEKLIAERQQAIELIDYQTVELYEYARSSVDLIRKEANEKIQQGTSIFRLFNDAMKSINVWFRSVFDREDDFDIEEKRHDALNKVRALESHPSVDLSDSIDLLVDNIEECEERLAQADIDDFTPLSETMKLQKIRL